MRVCYLSFSIEPTNKGTIFVSSNGECEFFSISYLYARLSNCSTACVKCNCILVNFPFRNKGSIFSNIPLVSCYKLAVILPTFKGVSCSFKSGEWIFSSKSNRLIRERVSNTRVKWNGIIISNPFGSQRHFIQNNIWIKAPFFTITVPTLEGVSRSIKLRSLYFVTIFDNLSFYRSIVACYKLNFKCINSNDRCFDAIKHIETIIRYCNRVNSVNCIIAELAEVFGCSIGVCNYQISIGIYWIRFGQLCFNFWNNTIDNVITIIVNRNGICPVCNGIG